MTEKAKENIQPYVRELIKSITELEPGDDKFSHYEHYVLSKIWNKNFVTVDRHAVKKSYEGIVKKFSIHGFYWAAERLKTLLDKASNSNDWERFQQNDIQWYVLSLLLHLSYSPTSTILMDCDAVQPDPVEKTDDFDWPAYLMEDQPDFISLSGGSETEDECLSFDELQGDCSSISEDILPCDSESLEKKKQDEIDQQQPVTTLSAVTTDHMWTYIENTTRSAHKWLNDNVQHPFVVGYKTQSKFVSANFAEFCEAHTQEITENKQPTQLMSEYRVLREILWCFQAPPSPTLCLQDDWKAMLFCDQRCIYRPRDSVTIPSLTKGSFQSQLKWLGRYVSLVRDMEEFIAEVSAARDSKVLMEDPDSESLQERREENLPPLTFEAYASALKEFLFSFKGKVLAVEKKIKHQNDICTLLSVNAELRLAFKELTVVHGIHQRSICSWKKYSNWHCACRLLIMLYGGLLSSSTDESATICYQIFMKTFQPYLDIIHVWLTEGRLEDWRVEFIIAKNELASGNTEDFWKEGFILRPYEEALVREGALGRGLSSCFPFGLLCLIEEKVLILGKNVELLQRLERLSEIHRSSPSFKTTLHSELLSAVDEELRAFMEQAAETKEEMSLQCSENECGTEDSMMESLVQSIQKTKDYHLKMAFEDILKFSNSDETTRQSSSAKPQKKQTTVPAVLPIKPVIERQLKKLIDGRHGMSSTIVRTLLLREFALANHLLVVRRIFLMEAGDLMHSFYSHVFEQAEMGEGWLDSLSLTNHLQECISARYPDVASNFSVAVSQPPELDTLQHRSNSNATSTSCGETLLDQASHIFINYAVHWPVSMVLSSATMESYNSVFQFLLKVRWALWSLQQLRFCELTGSKTGKVPKGMSVEHESESLPISAKIHRVQLLRAWLLHFVGSVYAYLMGQVLHVLGTKLEDDLESARDIDSIILVHEKYLEVMFRQCLQPKNSDVIKMAIMRVLEISMVLCKLWKHPVHITSIQLCEMENQYIRHHVFLARVLSNFMQHGFADHLKSLNSALVHSFPSH